MAKAVKVAAAIGRKVVSGNLDLREEGATQAALVEAIRSGRIKAVPGEER